MPDPAVKKAITPKPVNEAPKAALKKAVKAVPLSDWEQTSEGTVLNLVVPTRKGTPAPPTRVTLQNKLDLQSILDTCGPQMAEKLLQGAVLDSLYSEGVRLLKQSKSSADISIRLAAFVPGTDGALLDKIAREEARLAALRARQV
jgi:hypothetical protein